jgi:hypothetical protein
MHAGGVRRQQQVQQQRLSAATKRCGMPVCVVSLAQAAAAQ